MKLKVLILPIVIVTYIIFSKYISDDIMGNLFFLVLGYFVGDNFNAEVGVFRAKKANSKKRVARKRKEELVELASMDDEIESVAELEFKEEPLAIQLDEILEREEELEESIFTDDLSEEIIKTFWKHNYNMSASQIQRKYRIGYNRAARMIDEFEQLGLVTPLEGQRRSIIEQTFFEYGLNEEIEVVNQSSNDLDREITFSDLNTERYQEMI